MPTRTRNVEICITASVKLVALKLEAATGGVQEKRCF